MVAISLRTVAEGFSGIWLMVMADDTPSIYSDQSMGKCAGLYGVTLRRASVLDPGVCARSRPRLRASYGDPLK
jgi:hypothetical protein